MRRRRSVWAPRTLRDTLRDELILAEMLALGPSSAGLCVDTPELIFEGMLHACRAFNRDRNPTRTAVDAFEVWQGYADQTAVDRLMTTRSRSNYAIGQVYKIVST